MDSIHSLISQNISKHFITTIIYSSSSSSQTQTCSHPKKIEKQKQRGRRAKQHQQEQQQIQNGIAPEINSMETWKSGKGLEP